MTTGLYDGHPTANLILTPNRIQEIILLLVDVHGLLDYLYHEPATTPELIATARAYLHETASDHTLDTIIDAVDSLATYLTWAMRHAIIHPDPPDPDKQPPRRLLTQPPTTSTPNTPGAKSE
jgi:hypothetical protein